MSGKCPKIKPAHEIGAGLAGPDVRDSIMTVPAPAIAWAYCNTR